MTLSMRRLTLSDLPAIQELSDSMDIRNDPKIGDIAKALLQGPETTLFGAFKNDFLVGVAGLRNKGWELAWIESVRVHGEHQKIGVGTALFRHGEAFAREQGYQRVGFQTVTENAGSCRIGEILGYERKHEMYALWMNPQKDPIIEDKGNEQEELSTEEALLALKRIPNAPKDEICIGWSYAPITADYFSSQPDMKFYLQEDTIMLEYHDRDPNSKEVTFVKAILYGAGVGIESILSGFIARNAKLELPLVPLCSEELVPHVLKMGFHHATVWTGGHNIVVLFTKDL
ncbi:MAG: GNAT family N-acetyltransferase [Promethearchaeota archaeon]